MSLYKVSEVARTLRVSVATVHRLIANGTLPAFHVGRSVRINADDLNKLLNRSQA